MELLFWGWVIMFIGMAMKHIFPFWKHNAASRKKNNYNFADIKKIMYLCNVRRLFIILALCVVYMAVAQPNEKAFLASAAPSSVTTRPFLSELGWPSQFRTLGLSDGLRNNSVTCLLADSRGYLWIGSIQGLSRYDGHEIKTRFHESGDPSLYEVFNTPIKSIEEDGDGRIWIQCENSVYYLYDTQTAQFSTKATELLHRIGIRCGNKYKVKVSTNGIWWVISENGIWRYNSHTKELKHWDVRLPIPGALARVIAEMSDGLYISTDHAVWHFNSSSGDLQREQLPQAMENPMTETCLLADTDGTLWAYSTREDYICRYIVGGRCVKEMVALPSVAGTSQNNAIRDMIDDHRGNIWIATDHRGLFVYNKKTGSITNIRHQRDRLLSLASDNATCLEADDEGIIWVGHLKTGLSYTSDNNNMMQSHARQCGDILSMAYDTYGRLWMGTDGDGVYIENNDGSTVKTALPNITVMALLSDGQGGMWVGTYNQGLYHLSSPDRWERYSTEDGTFPSAEAWTLASDNKGNIWTSSPIGKTVVFNVTEKRSAVVTADNGADIHGNSLYYDGSGVMYIASEYGLWICNLYSGNKTVSFGNKKGTQRWLNQKVTDVSIDKQQQLIMLTHPNGVTLYDVQRDTLSFINRNNDEIKGLALDHDGNYWLCTTSGDVVGLQTIRWTDGTRLVSRNYSPNAGMPQFYFNGDAMVCSPNGEILMGGTEGYMSINPHQLMTARHKDLHLVISEIAMGDSLLNEMTGSVNLKHDATYLTVKFFSGSLASVQRARYAYRLVGQMNDWVITDHNYVSFYALPPGNYTLQLSVCLEDGTMSPPRELRICVEPPFYRTLPMYIVYGLVIIAILYLLWLWMHKRQQERTERQKQLMERQKMEQITEMKLQFFTNVSHDLRTPLTLIISPLEQILKKLTVKNGQLEVGITPDNLLAQLRNIHKNAKLLLNEVSALLDFRRLDAGGETLNVQHGDIVDHLNSILVSFGDYAEERGIRLSFDHDTDSFIMDYDREKINKVVYNLFSNALKFTPAGGSVTLSFFAGQSGKAEHSAGQDHVTIAVADTGKGIPDSDKPNIFRRFYQSAANDSSQTGSGIGLHIASDYVRLHHGTISVSDNKPVGSVFTITLPIAEKGVQHPALRDKEKITLDVPSDNHKTILIVDDNQDMLSFVSSCMKEAYDVRTATDGTSALELLQREQIDLIISDVMMPGIDGFELCRRVKNDISLSHIPIILLTARTTDVSRIEGLQLGADDYLTKPFNIEVLHLRVKKFIEWEQNNHRQFRQKMNIEPSEITITPLDEQFIKKTIALVEKNIGDSNFTVETLATEVAMSRTTLYKKLMAITGLGPAEFIRTIRIKRGRALLETSQMQITEIAYAVGFTTVKSFTMNFKAEYGMTPSEFKNRNTT